MKSIEELKQEIITYGKLAGVKNFTPGVSGNMSARYDNDKVLITSSGTANGYLKEDDFTLIDFDCNIISGEKKHCR